MHHYASIAAIFSAFLLFFQNLDVCRVYIISGLLGLIFLSLQLLEMTQKAAVFARQWIKEAQEAAQGGNCAISFHLYIF